MSDDPFIPWTEGGAERLRAAAADLAGAVLAHADAVIAARPDQDITAVIVAMDRLMPAVAAHGAAQFAFTGTAARSAPWHSSSRTRTGGPPSRRPRPAESPSSGAATTG